MFAKKIGIDLGTATVQVYVRGEGIVVDQPALVALDRLSAEILTFGDSAVELFEREPDTVRLAGSADRSVRERMVQHLIARVQGRQRLFRPEVMICVHSAATGDERRAMAEAAISAGARQAWLLEAPLAAAMGAGLPVTESRPHAVCDVGASTVEVAVVALSGLVVAHAAPGGGRDADAAIAAYLRARRGLVVDERGAEALKIAIGSAMPPERPASAQVTATDAATGAPMRAKVGAAEVAAAIAGPIERVVETVRGVLDQTPARLRSEVLAGGLVLTGGGARLDRLTDRLERDAGIAARVADDPHTCVVRGTRRALGQYEVIQRRQLFFR